MTLVQQRLADFAVGASFTTGARTISEQDVIGFSALTGDWHPQHLDAAWAAESVFGRRIVHGMLVVSCAIGLLELDPERVVALRSLRKLHFKRPVALGTAIHVVGAVDRVLPVEPGIQLAGLAFTVRDDEDRIAVRGELDALVRPAARRPA
jgi:3-hydroxybutyryl-CoA dehydratase